MKPLEVVVPVESPPAVVPPVVPVPVPVALVSPVSEPPQAASETAIAATRPAESNFLYVFM
jgi:hypothetical protein